MGVISIRKLILDNIKSTDYEEVKKVTHIICDKYNIPIDPHIENMIKGICGIEITEKLYNIHEIAKDLGLSEKQIRRKLRKLYGNSNSRWALTEKQYQEFKKEL